jgi:hypothetical protein
MGVLGVGTRVARVLDLGTAAQAAPASLVQGVGREQFELCVAEEAEHFGGRCARR